MSSLRSKALSLLGFTLSTLSVSFFAAADEYDEMQPMVMHPSVFWGAQFEELELRLDEDSDKFGVWNGDAFIGSDEFKLRWISQGEYSDSDKTFEQLENHLVGQIPVSTFFDAKAGFRFDTPEGPNTTYALIGLSGLAPYWFEIDTNLYLSDDGDISADIDVEYELLITNRLILTASLDADVAFSENKEIALGKGLNSTEAGLRLRYDLVGRQLSPYIGVVQEQLWGDSAAFSRQAGGRSHDVLIVAGTKIMF
jgi:copper resistance protein B